MLDETLACNCIIAVCHRVNGRQYIAVSGGGGRERWRERGGEAGRGGRGEEEGEKKKNKREMRE